MIPTVQTEPYAMLYQRSLPCVWNFCIIRFDRILIIKIIFIVSGSLTNSLCSYPISGLILQIALFIRTFIIYVRIPETQKERVFGKKREIERECVWGKHSMLKNSFERIKPVVPIDGHSSSNLVDWNYRIAETVQIKKKYITWGRTFNNSSSN